MSETSKLTITNIPTADPFFQFRQQTGKELDDYVKTHEDGELSESIAGHFSVKSTKEEWGGAAKFAKKWGIPISHIISAASAYPGVSLFCGLMLSFFPFLGYEFYTGQTVNLTIASVLGFVLSVFILYGIEMGFDYFLYKLVPKMQNKALRAQYGKSLWFYWVGTIVMGLISFFTSYFGATESPKMVIKEPTAQVAQIEDIAAPASKSMELIDKQAAAYDNQIAEQQSIISANQNKEGWKAALNTRNAKKAMGRLQQEKSATVGNLTGLGATTINGINTRNAVADSMTNSSNRQKRADYERRLAIGSWLNGGISIFAQIFNAIFVVLLCWFEYSVLKEESQINKQTTSQQKQATSQQGSQAANDNVFGSGVIEEEIEEKPAISNIPLKPVIYEGENYSVQDIQNILKSIKTYYKRSKTPISSTVTGANRTRSLNAKRDNLNKVKTWAGVLSCLGILVILNEDGSCDITYNNI